MGKFIKHGSAILGAIAIVFTVGKPAQGQVNVLTSRNDNSRTGANTNETILTLSNVTFTTFGKVFSQTVDGYVYAQPLCVGNVTIPGKGTHNIVIVATEHDSVYAFDADSGAGTNATPLWKTSFLNAAAGISTVPSGVTACSDIQPEVGITGTPVVDPVTGTIYVDAVTMEVTNSVMSFSHHLHALDISTGTDKTNVLVQGTYPGGGDSNDGNSNVVFNAFYHYQRPGLVLLNGVVYVSFGSHCDTRPVHGWMFAYDAATLQRLSIYNTTPNGNLGSIWQSGGAPSTDAGGNIYFSTGNGSLITNSDFSDSVLKLATPPKTNVFLTDYFIPFNSQSLSDNDRDLGSGGNVLLPDSVGSAAHPHLMVTAGKEGRIYLIDRDNMGHFNPTTDQVVQSLPASLSAGSFDTPAYFNNRLYYAGYNDYAKFFGISNAVITPATAPSTVSGVFFSFPGANLSISANGTSNGIAWAIENGSSIMHALNATNFVQEIYNTTLNSARDSLGSGTAVKFAPPTIANGKVYVGTATALLVYGLQTQSPDIVTPPQTQSVIQGSNAVFTVVANGAAPLRYQWFFNGAIIANATNTSLVVTNVQTNNLGGYTVGVTNSVGAMTSVVATLAAVSPLKDQPSCAPAPAGLITWWPGEGNANDIFDSNNGTPQNGVSYVAGEVGQAFSFNGVNQFVYVGATNVPPPWTASFWVNRQNGGSNSSVVLGDYSYSIKVEQEPTARRVGFSQIGVGDFSFNYTAPLGTWVNLTFVATNNQTLLYTNGVLQGTIANTIPLPRRFIGCTSYPNVGFMAGRLDEVVLFNRALASPEIASIVAAGTNGLCRVPKFTGITKVSGGQVAFSLQGQPGKNYTIYSSSNLVNWFFLATAFDPTAMLQFTNPASQPYQFFKASQP